MRRVRPVVEGEGGVKPGDLVRISECALAAGIGTQIQRERRGRVVRVRADTSGHDHVTVHWDGNKWPGSPYFDDFLEVIPKVEVRVDDDKDILSDEIMRLDAIASKAFQAAGDLPPCEIARARRLAAIGFKAKAQADIKRREWNGRTEATS